MTFKVEPTALSTYAAELVNLYSEVEMAENYIKVHGDFSFHQAGVIGKLSGQHAGLMQQLQELHDKLEVVLWRSNEALRAVADSYQDSDQQSAARVDASYPTAPRPTPNRD
ncbi:hypothetical protein [Winogradskya humida]|uniref:Excreted virulence factor EspC (Type VII ESX diderm) n=1 Tax=Winogradskya humida TaxID=113566 RepID=A0ABQ3ZU75_9ACTN|nr:hypothetical protein [Actinoplanes humidus]GIE22141.1 hypothetical protein Ahu01nite_052430 [Actinoplanes humidus]